MIIKLYHDNNQANNLLLDKNFLQQIKIGCALQPLLALDIGKKRIGIASTDPHHLVISPLKIINSKNQLEDCQKIIDIAVEKNIKILIIGIPIGKKFDSDLMSESQNKDNSTHSIYNHINEFSKILLDEMTKRISRPQIIMINESLSSFEARRIIRENFYLHHRKKYRPNNLVQKKFYDDVAASVIMQYFIEEFL